MAECEEDPDALFEEAWNRIPNFYVGQRSNDCPSTLIILLEGQSTQGAWDSNKTLTNQNALDDASSLAKETTETNGENRSKTTQQGSSDTNTSSAQLATENGGCPDSWTDGSSVKVDCTELQDLGEIKDGFDVFEVKYEPEGDSNDFYAEQHHVLNITEDTSKSLGQQPTTNGAGTTSRAHLFRAVRANKKPSVYVEEPDVEEPHTPQSEMREEMESNEQDRANIKSIVRERNKLKKKEESKMKIIENVYVEEPDVEEPHTPPNEMSEEMESNEQDRANIKSIVGERNKMRKKEGMKRKNVENVHLKEPLWPNDNDFCQGLKRYQSRGKYTDVCIDKVRDNVERVVIGKKKHYRCKLCLKTLLGIKPIIKHAWWHVKGTYFVCDKCGRKFKTKFSYDVHREFHAQGLWREIPGPGSRLYTCAMCHKFFPTNALLSSHKITHTEESPFQCGICGESFRNAGLRNRHEFKTHQKARRKRDCSVCGQVLSSKKSLDCHMRKHKYYKADLELFACDKCSETFRSESKLVDHLKARHPFRPFSATCEKCGRSFCLPCNLTQHQRVCTADKPRKFSCKTCGKEFATSMAVTRHKKIHSDARPYKCRHCDMTFKYSDTRHRHEILHFKDGEFRDVKRHTWKVSHGKDGRQLRRAHKIPSMAKCEEDPDALFEEAWNRIPSFYVGQRSNDCPSTLIILLEGQPTQGPWDANKTLTKQNAVAEDDASPLAKATTETNGGNRSKTTQPGSSDTNTSSAQLATENRACPDSGTDGTSVKVESTEVQDLGEIKEGFDVFEVKYEPEGDSNDFYAEKHHVLNISEDTSKSPGQQPTTNGAGTTSRAHLFRAVRANKKPDVYVEGPDVEEPDVEEPHTPSSEMGEEMESPQQDRGNIKSIVRERKKFKKKEESKKKNIENVHVEEPDVEEPHTPPSEMREEMESNEQDRANIKRIVRERNELRKKEEIKKKNVENLHLKEPLCLDDNNDFYQGLKRYQSRGKYTDVCIDKVRDNVERVVIGKKKHYRCKLCLKIFPCIDSIIVHAWWHVKGTYFVCDKCGRKFGTKFSYDVHLEFHAQGLWREIPGPGSRLYTCSMCHKFFPTNALLSSHKITHKEESPFQCGICDESFRNAGLRNRHEFKTHQKARRKRDCSVCGQVLSSKKSLDCHMRKHKYYKADLELFACDKCSETFRSESKLVDHLKARHPFRPFSATCEKCGRSFCLPCNLTQHQRVCTADKPRKYSCKTCGKEFATSMAVTRHKKIHSDARPYKCRHCDMTFKYSDTRHRHEILHFKDGEFRDVKRHTWKVSHGKDGRQLR
ncbi:uncharacterized protein [Diadema antillarum]|uniref:uncharacterized protein n=1 Tax=Diadema antillarum TaxID=105358 RepID=UPI003A8BD12C